MATIVISGEITMDKKWEKRKQRVFEIIEIGTHYDYASRAYDFFNALSILVNLTVSILYTFNDIEAKYGIFDLNSLTFNENQNDISYSKILYLK